MGAYYVAPLRAPFRDVVTQHSTNTDGHSTVERRMRAGAGDETAGRRRTVGKYDTLQLEAVDALVPRVQHVLILPRAANRPKLAVDEPNEVVDRKTRAAEDGREQCELGRPALEAALVHQVRKAARTGGRARSRVTGREKAKGRTCGECAQP